MKWCRAGRGQVLYSNGYYAEILKRKGYYWATCYEVFGSVRVKKFIFPPKTKIRPLKDIVENNSLFIEEREVAHNETVDHEEEMQWWQK